MNARETIVFKRKDEWVFECITKIVSHKKDVGMPTSFSNEAVRLMKTGLISHMEGSELDRLILKGNPHGSSSTPS